MTYNVTELEFYYSQSYNMIDILIWAELDKWCAEVVTLRTDLVTLWAELAQLWAESASAELLVAG